MLSYLWDGAYNIYHIIEISLRVKSVSVCNIYHITEISLES